MNKLIKVLGLAVFMSAMGIHAQEGRVIDTFFSGASLTTTGTNSLATNRFTVFIPANKGEHAAVTAFGYVFDTASDPAVFKAYSGKASYNVTQAAAAAGTTIKLNNPSFTSSAGMTTNDIVIIPDGAGYVLRTVSAATATNITLSGAFVSALTTSSVVYDTDGGVTFAAPSSYNGSNFVSFTGKWFFPGQFPVCIEGKGAAAGLAGRGYISGYIAK